jgi:predicted transcriptional regulator
MEKKKNPPLEVPNPDELEVPNPGELEVLATLWAEELAGNRPLKLSEVHRRVCAMRREHGDPEPALTTISTHLRKLSDKDLIRAVKAGDGPPQRQAGGTRGMLTPATRSPNTSYQALHQPGDVLFTTFQALAAAYPRQRRREALLDFARALELSSETLQKLHKLLE